MRKSMIYQVTESVETTETPSETNSTIVEKILNNIEKKFNNINRNSTIQPTPSNIHQ